MYVIYIHDFPTLFNALMMLGVLIGAVLFMREVLNMKGMSIFFVIAFLLIGNYLTAIYGLSSY